MWQLYLNGRLCNGNSFKRAEEEINQYTLDELKQICIDNDITMIWGIGGGKVQSSSDLVFQIIDGYVYYFFRTLKLVNPFFIKFFCVFFLSFCFKQKLE